MKFLKLGLTNTHTLWYIEAEYSLNIARKSHDFSIPNKNIGVFNFCCLDIIYKEKGFGNKEYCIVNVLKL